MSQQYSSASGLWNSYSTNHIYPVIKHNNAYLAGESGYIRSSPSVFLISLYALGVLIATSLWFYFVLSRVGYNATLEQTDKVAQASVTDHRIATSTHRVTRRTGRGVPYTYDETVTQYYLTYTFVAKPTGSVQNKAYTKEAEVTSDMYSQYPIKSSLKIFYLPADPNKSQLPPPTDDLGWDFMVVGVGYTIAFIIGLFAIFTWRTNRFLVRKGVLLPAQVVSMGLIYGQSDNDSWQKWKKAIKFTYSFITTDGETITRSTQVDCNGYTEAISQTSRLIVLYHDKRRFRLL